MYQPKREHFIAMMNMHYAAADFYAAESERHPFPSKAHERCLRDAAQALELAEQCRVLSKSESTAHRSNRPMNKGQDSRATRRDRGPKDRPH